MSIPSKEVFSLPSPEIDRYYGMRVKEIEDSLFRAAKSLRPEGNLSNLGHVLHNGHQTWVGLEPEMLLTPYSELRLLCDLLAPSPGALMVDLGAGYGRLGIVLAEFYPGVSFQGYELVPERVLEGNRVFFEHQFSEAQLFTQDLTDQRFKLPAAEFYFLYDYGKVAHIRETVKQLEDLADRKKNFKVIARGRGVRSIIDHENPWLSDIHPVHREENFSIYSTSL